MNRYIRQILSVGLVAIFVMFSDYTRASGFQDSGGFAADDESGSTSESNSSNSITSDCDESAPELSGCGSHSGDATSISSSSYTSDSHSQSHSTSSLDTISSSDDHKSEGRRENDNSAAAAAAAAAGEGSSSKYLIDKDELREIARSSQCLLIPDYLMCKNVYHSCVDSEFKIPCEHDEIQHSDACLRYRKCNGSHYEGGVTSSHREYVGDISFPVDVEYTVDVFDKNDLYHDGFVTYLLTEKTTSVDSDTRQPNHEVVFSACFTVNGFTTMISEAFQGYELSDFFVNYDHHYFGQQIETDQIEYEAKPSILFSPRTVSPWILVVAPLECDIHNVLRVYCKPTNTARYLLRTMERPPYENVGYSAGAAGAAAAAAMPEDRGIGYVGPGAGAAIPRYGGVREQSVRGMFRCASIDTGMVARDNANARSSFEFQRVEGRRKQWKGTF